MSEGLVQGARSMVQGLYGVLVPGQSQQTHQRRANEEMDSEPEYGMEPPPDFALDSREKLLDCLKSWAASQGYAVVIGRSRTNRLWIRCDRGGSYHDKHAHDPDKRLRKRKISRLTGCEFSVKASMRKDGIWRSRTEHGEHNHGPSEDLRDHPSLRRMTDEQLRIVHEKTETGSTPAEIMAELVRLWPDIKVIRRDIYNARKNFKSGRDSISQPPSGPPQEGTDERTSSSAGDGKWVWAEEGQTSGKRRRVRKAAKAQQSTASTSVPDGSSSVLSDPYATHPRPGHGIAPHTQAPPPAWTDISVSDSLLQQSPIPNRQTAFDPPTVSSPIPPGNRTGTSSDNCAPGPQFESEMHPTYSFGPTNPPTFPQQILTTNQTPTEIASNSHSSGGTTIPQSQKTAAQTQIHPSLLHNNTVGVNNGPVGGRSESQNNSIHQQQTQPQPQQITASRTPVNTGAGTPISRPATASAQSNLGDAGATPTAGTSNPAAGQKQSLSGAMMMQRMQRVEDELKEQKTELRDQKNILNQILAAVQSIKGG